MVKSFQHGVPPWAIEYAGLKGDDKAVQSLTITFSNADFTRVNATYIVKTIQLHEGIIVVIGEQQQ